MFRFAAALVVLGLVAAPLHAADKTMTAKGTVKTVAADSLTITDSAGHESPPQRLRLVVTLIGL